MAWRPSRGQAGLCGAGLLWVGSLGALALSMQANLAASTDARMLRLHQAAPEIAHLHAGAVFFAIGCTILQLSAGLAAAFTVRAAYHLRTATCYALAIVLVIAADVAGLFGLLVWMRFHDPL